jgi:hypothetical protein
LQGRREAAKNRPSAAAPGDPVATRGAILKVVDAQEPPLRIFFGKTPLEMATKDYQSRLATWNQWQPVYGSFRRAFATQLSLRCQWPGVLAPATLT